jgi:sortase A
VRDPAVRALGYLGKFLISVGLGVLMFLAWIVWGTSYLITDRQQERLEREFEALPAVARAGGRERLSGPPKGFRPGPGDPVFRLRIPSTGLDAMVVEGVGADALELGPGHYPSCRPDFPPPLCTELPAVWPGQRGRVIVSGHRTTYGKPFWAIDELSEGDALITETKWGRFTYRVTGKEVVPPSSRDIANPAATGGAEIVLTTCDPRFSAERRLIVYGELEAAT